MFVPELLRSCWFLAGPTACGKTAVSLPLAERLQAEIIAMDSMTLYRDLNIGTAKATAAERQRIPHHLIDVLDPGEEYSVAAYLEAAEAAAREILSRGRVPLFVGGTGLYLRALLRGVFEGPPADWTIRQRLEDLAQQAGPQALHQTLTRLDPISAQRLHPNDTRRVIRALEVQELTGQPLSSLQQHGPRPVDERPPHVYWLSPERDWLYERINQRVTQMFADGFVAEVSELLRRGQTLSRTAQQAVGYQEVIAWLNERPAEASRSVAPADVAAWQPLIAAIQQRTRQFAKRQGTWFRNLEEGRAVLIDGTQSPEQIVERLFHVAHFAAPTGGSAGHAG